MKQPSEMTNEELASELEAPSYRSIPYGYSLNKEAAKRLRAIKSRDMNAEALEADNRRHKP